MAGYSIARKEDAIGLLDMLRNHRREQGSVRGGLPVGMPFIVPPEAFKTEGFIFFTPSNGIPGRQGDTPGFADCVEWFVNPVTRKLEELQLTDGSPATYEIANIFEGAIQGNRYIFANFNYSVLVASAEDCPFN